MDKYLDEDAELKKLLEELPMSNEMPPHVRDKAMSMAVEANRKAQAARRPRTVAWLTAGLATAAVAALFLSPKPAKAWSMVEQAVEKVTSFQMQLKVNDSVRGPQEFSIAVKNGEMLMNTEKGTAIYMGNGSLETYDENSNTITKMMMPIEVTSFMPNLTDEMLGAFDLKKEIAKMEEKFGKDHIRVMPIRQQDGRRVYDVVMTDPKGPGKSFLTIDANTDLPIYIEAEGEKEDENIVIHLRYNGDVTIKPKFPANAKVQTLDLSNMKGMFEGKDMNQALELFGKQAPK